MACGTPVIGTRVAGIEEIIDPGVNGELVELGNVVQMAEKIDLLLNSRNHYDKLVSNGRKLVKRKFNLYKAVKKLEQIYIN